MQYAQAVPGMYLVFINVDIGVGPLTRNAYSDEKPLLGQETLTLR